MDTPKSILLASVLLSIVIGVNFHLDRQDTACVNLFNGIGDSSMVSFVALYNTGRLKKEFADGIRYAEKMHGITAAQCMKR